jgi:hypothetical protein
MLAGWGFAKLIDWVDNQVIRLSVLERKVDEIAKKVEVDE